MDLDLKFSVWRLVSVLEEKVAQSLMRERQHPNPVEFFGDTRYSALLEQCLNRCEIVQCASWTEAVATLFVLRQKLTEQKVLVAFYFFLPLFAFSPPLLSSLKRCLTDDNASNNNICR